MLIQMQEKGILKNVIRFLLFVSLTSCIENSNNENFHSNKESEIRNKSSIIVGENTYSEIKKTLIDTVKSWQLNKINSFHDESGQSDFMIDTLLAINQKSDRLVSCLLSVSFIKPNPTGGISIILGEKINNNWYFFLGGGHVFIPNELKKGIKNEPFSFPELHHIALKEVYGGYLNAKNEINEDWFTSLFEGPGWGDFNDQSAFDWFLKGKRFKTKKEYYEFVHMEKVRNNWLQRDTTRPIIPLN